MVIESFPAHKKTILNAEYKSFDTSGTHTQFIGDMITVVEAWHLPSGDGAD